MRYILKRPNSYYFRLRIPLDMMQYFGRREIKKSLHTKSYRYAKSLVINYLSDAERIFTMIRTGTLTDKMIKKLALEYLDDFVDRHEKMVKGDLELEYPEAEEKYKKRKERYFQKIETEEDQENYIKYLSKKISRLRCEYNKRNGHNNKMLRYYADKYLAHHNIEIDKESREYSELCNEFLSSDITFLKNINEHLQGNYDTQYDVERRNRVVYKSLRDLMQLYEEDRGPNWIDKSRIKGIHRQILHIVGDIPLNEIDRNVSIKLATALKDYPKGLSEKDMHVPWEKLSKKRTGRLSERTQHFIKTTFSTLVKYAKEQEMGIKGNPAKGIAGKKPVVKHAHTPYTKDELQSLVNILTTVNTDKNPEKFWIPLLLLYTGARSNEICMLRCDDIEQEENIWVIKFRNNPEYKQRTKNGKERQCPIHNHLIRIGFLKYVEEQRRRGRDRVFSNLKRCRDKWNVYFGKDYNRTFKNKFLQGLSPEELKYKDLHSFRKTMISWFVQNRKYSNVTDISVLQSIIGHFESADISNLLQFLEASTLTTNVYGGGYSRIDSQNKLLQCLDYGLDLKKLKGKF